MRTPSCARKPEAPDDSAFDGNAIFSVNCQDGGSFTSVSTCSELTFSFVAVVRDAIAASSFAGAVITWKTMSRWSTARISSTVAALLDVPRGPVKLIGELTVHTAGGTVVGFTKCAITKLHWSWIVHDSPILQKRCEPLRACSLLHGRKPVVVCPGVCNHESSAGDVTIDGSARTADCAHLRYGSTCC